MKKNGIFSYHTFMMTVQITNDVAERICDVIFHYASAMRLPTHREKDTNMVLCTIYADKGIIIRVHKGTEQNSFPYIEFRINPQHIIDSMCGYKYNPFDIFECTKKTVEYVADKIDYICKDLTIPCSFQNMSLTRLDLCTNRYFDTYDHVRAYMKLVKKMKYSNRYALTTTKYEDMGHKHSHTIENDYRSITVYNKTHQVSKLKNIDEYEPANVLRVELSLKRKAVKELQDKSQCVDNKSLLVWLGENSRNIMEHYIGSILFKGSYKKYNLAKADIHRLDIKPKKKKKMLAMLREVSKCKNVNNAIENLGLTYKWNEQKCQRILESFKNADINPVTITQKMPFDELPSLYDVLFE